MQIEKKRLLDLLPAEYNPRKDLQPGDTEYEKIKRSIQTFGYVEPIIWNQQSGHIIGGHQRLKVLIDLGVTEESVVVVDLPPSEEKALNVALNKISGEWDVPKLQDLLSGLDADLFDVTLTGFDIDEVERIMAQTASDLSEEIDGAGGGLVKGVYLIIDKTKIPMTDEENADILARLENYVGRHGVVFGFVGDLLGT